MSIDSTEFVLSINLLLISIINLFLILFSFYHGLKIKLFHQNFRILQLEVLFSFFIIAAACLVYVIKSFVEDTFFEPTQLYAIVLFIMNFGTTSLRPIAIAFVVERAFATIKRSIYEKRSYLRIPMTLMVITHLWSLTQSTFFSFGYLETYINEIIILAFDISSLIMIFILRKWNRRLIKLSFNSFLSLTQRYQITENIRAINAVYPLLLTIALCNLISMSLSTIVYYTGFGVSYLILIFHGFVNYAIFISILLTLITDHTYKERILYKLPYLKTIIQAFRRKKVVDIRTNHKTLPNDMDVYFKILNDTWK